jgi:hypothetical protein
MTDWPVSYDRDPLELMLEEVGAARRQKRDTGVLGFPPDRLELVLTAYVGRAVAGGAGARACWIDLAAIALAKALELPRPGGGAPSARAGDPRPPPHAAAVGRAIREAGPDALTTMSTDAAPAEPWAPRLPYADDN